MEIRKATEADIPAVTAIYDALLDREEQGLLTTGWPRGVYPTEQTARDSLAAGTLYVLEDGGVKAECVVTDEGGGILELKNLAVEPEAQRKGYGKALIDFLVRKYKGRYSVLQVGTGNSPLTIPFYEKCGFVCSHRIPNFFTDHYDHPIYEAGVQLVDMVYLQKPL